jgi:hypothetical protein
MIARTSSKLWGSIVIAEIVDEVFLPVVRGGRLGSGARE